MKRDFIFQVFSDKVVCPKYKIEYFDHKSEIFFGPKCMIWNFHVSFHKDGRIHFKMQPDTRDNTNKSYSIWKFNEMSGQPQLRLFYPYELLHNANSNVPRINPSNNTIDLGAVNADEYTGIEIAAAILTPKMSNKVSSEGYTKIWEHKMPNGNIFLLFAGRVSYDVYTIFKNNPNVVNSLKLVSANDVDTNNTTFGVSFLEEDGDCGCIMEMNTDKAIEFISKHNL